MSIAGRRSLLHRLAAIILLAGLGSAFFIWQAQDRLDRQNAAQAANPGAPLALLDSGKYTREVEIYYGKTGLLMEQAKEWFHGKPLAKLVAISSAATAAGLFLLAARLPR